MEEECVFCKIATKQIPTNPIYEDDEFLAFRDLNPQAPVHVLLIPKHHYSTLEDASDTDFIGRAMQAACRTACILELSQEGYRLVINTRENGGQTVYHLHIHILGGRFMSWPPG